LRIVRHHAELRELGHEVGFIPTMGALHEGHLSLIRQSASERLVTVVSIFVNPLQFGPQEDFVRYPRDEARDADLAAQAGADVLFVPDASWLTEGILTTIHVGKIGDRFEGEFRPGHFDGVATIVCKLFNLIGSCRAYFGLKDLQQCAIIQAMVRDLNMPIELRFLPTIREVDGLAMSSRNIYLTSEERDVAPNLHRILTDCAVEMANRPVKSCLEHAAQTLKALGLEVDYLACVDRNTFADCTVLSAKSALIAAVRLGAVRLIDNLLIEM
jgi:pantoate--beta-alanine ligase